VRPTFDPTTAATANRPINKGAAINGDTSRLDGVAKVTGRAKYSRDMYLPKGVFVGYVRCPFGAGELESFDRDAALGVPGVVDVEVSGKEGKYHGQQVGYVVAESPLAMKRGIRALRAKWKQLPAKIGRIDEVEDAAAPSGEAKAILDKADYVLTATYSTAVQTHVSLETHGGVVDHKGDSATMYSSTQGTFAARDGMKDILDLPNSQIEVICEYVGAGFGSKLNGPGKEGQVAGRVSKKLGRPAYCFVDRKEDQLDTGNRPSHRASVMLGFTKDGTILGGEIRTWGGIGVAGGGGNIPLPTGRYDFGEIKKKHADVKFNAGAPRPFRAPGHPPAAFFEELVLDEIATTAGVDPVELRIRLERDEDRKEMMRLGSKLIGWENRKATGSQKGVIRRGYGLGTCTWHQRATRTACEIVINRDGSVEARTGTQDIGTGQKTIMGVLAADGLGIPLSMVTVRLGNSSLPEGPGSGGSMVAPNTGPAMMSAAEDARKKLLDAVGKIAGVDAAGLTVKDAKVMQGDKALMSFAEACGKLSAETITGHGEWSDQHARNDTTKGHSHGVQFADVEVDTETGIVRVKRVVAFQSGGRIICRKTSESQVIGGVIQGISYALFEDRILDRTTGAMVNPNMEWYKILGPNDMPHIEPILWTRNQTGIRSLGEPPSVPTAAAVAGAVYNAIGVPMRHLPITPDKVLAALEGGKS
jgi:xanthine dehydrogenase YagR molybdenum-binding subunit